MLGITDIKMCFCAAGWLAKDDKSFEVVVLLNKMANFARW